MKNQRIMIVAVLAVALISFGCSPSNKDNDQQIEKEVQNEVNMNIIEYKKITPEQAKARIDSEDELVILDVRTKEEYADKHIESAIVLPNEDIVVGTLPTELPNLDAEILIYCRSGNRSAQAAKKLIEMGYTNVSDFGGLNTWGYETVSGE